MQLVERRSALHGPGSIHFTIVSFLLSPSDEIVLGAVPKTRLCWGSVRTALCFTVWFCSLVKTEKKTPHNKSPKSCGTQCDFLCSLWEDLRMDLLWQPANSKQPTLRLLLQTVDAARNNRSICSLVKGTALHSLKLGEASSSAG